jgi:hypothetical protein
MGNISPRPSNIFLSRARLDETAPVAIYDVLKSFGCSVFVDEQSLSLMDSQVKWTDLRDKAIHQCDEVRLIVTENIFDNSDGGPKQLREMIQQELDLARNLNKPIRAIILNRSAFDQCLQLNIFSNDQEQMLDLVAEFTDPSLGLKSTVARQKLWNIAFPHTEDYLLQLSREAKTWATDLLCTISRDLLPEDVLAPWENTLQIQNQSRPGLYVLIAPGGEGKTVSIARRIRAHPEELSLLIPLETIYSGPDAVARHLGTATADNLDELVGLWTGHWRLSPVFYIDALEHLLSPATQGLILNVVALLSRLGPVIATARPEIWNTEIKFMLLHARTIDITGLAAETYHRRANSPNHLKRLLVNALLIDYWIANQDLLTSEPHLTPKTLIIHYILAKPHVSIHSAIPTTFDSPPSRKEVYDAIAKSQIHHSSFDVKKADVVDGLTINGYSHAKVVCALERDYLIIHNRIDSTLRLRHDLLDAANCADFLISSSKSTRTAFFDSIKNSMGMQIAESLLRFLAEPLESGCDVTLNMAEVAIEAKESLYETFDLLLRMLDVKKTRNHLAWCSTWMLENLLRGDRGDVFARVVLKAIAGSTITSLDQTCSSINTPGTLYSCLSAENPRRTVECLSSLTSVWRVFEPGKAPLSDLAVQIFGYALTTTPYRFRIIEALTKYPVTTSQPLIISLTFGLINSLKHGDIRDRRLLSVLVAYIGAARPLDVAGLETLLAICNCSEAPHRARRLAHNITHPHNPRRISLDELTEELVLTSDINPSDPSDWHLICEYTNEIAIQVNKGFSFPDEIRTAVGNLLMHRHIAAAVAAAVCLGRLGGAIGVYYLFRGMVSRQPEASVLHAIRTAIYDLVTENRAKDQTLIVKVKSCLIIAYALFVTTGDSVRGALCEVLSRDLALPLDCSPDDDTLFTPTANEIPFSIDTKNWHVVSDNDVPEYLSLALDVIRGVATTAIGEETERKLRFVITGNDGRGRYSFGLARSSWRNGHGFHLGLRQPQNETLRLELLLQCVTIPEAILSSLPGLAVVHVICLLSDDLVLATRRPSGAKYAAERWSLSIEEQLKAEDLTDGDTAIRTATLRGLKEELNLDPNHVSAFLFESVVLEHPNLNIGVVVGVQLGVTIEWLRSYLKQSPAVDGHEVENLEAIAPNDPDLGGANRLLHPTSLLRLRMLQRFLIKRTPV